MSEAILRFEVYLLKAFTKFSDFLLPKNQPLLLSIGHALLVIGIVSILILLFIPLSGTIEHILIYLGFITLFPGIVIKITTDYFNFINKNKDEKQTTFNIVILLSVLMLIMGIINIIGFLLNTFPYSLFFSIGGIFGTLNVLKDREIYREILSAITVISLFPISSLILYLFTSKLFYLLLSLSVYPGFLFGFILGKVLSHSTYFRNIAKVLV